MTQFFVGVIIAYASLAFTSSAYAQSFGAFVSGSGDFLDTTTDPGLTGTHFVFGGTFTFDPSSIDVQKGQDGSEGKADGEADAEASAGDGKAKAVAHVLMSNTGGGASDSGIAEAQGSISDALLFTGDGIPKGTPLQVISGWKVDGNTTGSVNFGAPAPGHVPGDTIGTVSGAYSASATVTGSGIVGSYTGFQMETVKNGVLTDFEQQSLPDKIPITLNLLAGDFFTLNVNLEAIVHASSSSSDFTTNTGSGADGRSNFGHTLLWAGITSVTANGMPVSNWAVTSASGFNYANAAVDTPEPSSLLLLMFGASALTITLQKRTRVHKK
jgi:hypothetical protein